jgi:acid phosphatase (class A)
MKRSLFPLLLCLLSLHVLAQQTRERIPGFLNPEDLPNAARYLATPPQPGDGAFLNDRYYYNWGKEQRETPQGAQAALDEVQKTHEAFSSAAGFNISYEQTPEIFRLVEGARRDARTTNRKAKEYFQRTRPFVYFKEPSINPETDEEYKTSYSFPSGHSVRGWVYALTLALIVPDSTEALIARAQEYAINRVICGRHWKSDIDASLVEATAMMSRLLSNAAFLEQLEKARKEYARLRKD